MDQQPQFDLRPAMTASHGQQHPTAGGPGSHGQGEYAVPGAGTTGSSATGSHRDESAVSKPIRRRMRMITSCLECRRRKLRCDKAHPCHNCVRFQRECVYLGPKLDEASQLRLTELKEKVGSLERQLERDVAKGTAARRGGDGSDQRSFLSHGGEDEYDEDRDLEITPMVALDLTYDDSSDGNGADELVDLGVRVGRMRITERIGGLNRPRLSEEIQAGISDSQIQPYRPSHGPAGACEATEPPDVRLADFQDFLRPGESYLAPTSGFFFGQTGQPLPLLDLLLPQDIGHMLVRRYFEAVHPIARCVHRPSFEQMYRTFWDDVRQNIEPRASVQAVVFAAWFSAAVSVDEVFARQHGCTKTQLVTRVKIGTETALSKANFLRTTRFETLQAFTMYLLPLCREEVCRGHSVLVGAAIRMAECMGLHRDGTAFGLTPLETQVRRLVWHQICFLDIRTCEAQGPRPAIRLDDYDTKLPVNCEEGELTPQTTAMPAPAERWTSTLLSIVRFEIYEMMRTIWADRRRLETHRTTLTAMLSKIENFRKRMFDKYNRLLDERVPIQKYAKLVMQLLIYRLHAMVLHPYHANTTNPLPDKLNGLLVSSGILIIEIAMQLESGAMFREWAWYLGAYQQYQIALLLATEVYYRPSSKAAQRIWPCLDWVFHLDPNRPRGQKILEVLTEIMSKASVYMGMRKVRAPTTTSRAVPGKQAVKDSPPVSPPQPQKPPPTKPHPVSRHQLPPQQPIPSHPMPQPPSQGPPPFQPPQHHPNLNQPEHAISSAAAMSASMAPAQTLPGPQPDCALVSSSLAPPGVPIGMIPPPPPPPPPPPQPRQQLGVPPPSYMVYSGVSNGEVLWGFPPANNASSPGNSSDGGGSVVGALPMQGSSSIAAPPINVMDNIDWDTLNMLFPTDPQTGQLSFNSFVDPGMGSSGEWRN